MVSSVALMAYRVVVNEQDYGRTLQAANSNMHLVCIRRVAMVKILPG